MNKIKSLAIFTLLLSGLLKLGVAEAVQEFNYCPNDKIKGVISPTFMNRIQFGGSPIIQIIGDESKYSIIPDERGINLFLSPKAKVGENIELALIDAAGRVADLLLKVINIEGQVITINIPNYLSIKPKSSKTKSWKSRVNKGCDILLNTSQQMPQYQEMQRMLKHMIKDDCDKYYVSQVNREITKFAGKNLTGQNLRSKNLKIVQDRIYRYGKYVGARLRVTNLNKKNKESIELTELEFGNLFEGERKLVVLENYKLNSGKNSFVWIALEERKDD